MASIRVSTVIDAPVSAVWAHLEQIERHVEWMADAESITFTGDRQRGVGTRFDCVTRVGPIRLTDRMEITEWEPEQAMTVRHEGVVTGEGRFTLTPGGPGRTEFRWEEGLSYPWWMGGSLGERVGARVLERIWRRNLNKLEAIVESA